MRETSDNTPSDPISLRDPTAFGFPEESDPWIVKFRMEFDIPEEYDPRQFLVQIFFNYSSGFALLTGWFSGQDRCPGRLCHVQDVRVRVWYRFWFHTVSDRILQECQIPS